MFRLHLTAQVLSWRHGQGSACLDWAGVKLFHQEIGEFLFRLVIQLEQARLITADVVCRVHESVRDVAITLAWISGVETFGLNLREQWIPDVLGRQ